MGEISAVFRRKDVGPQSMASTKLNFQKPDFIPANKKLKVFHDKLQKLAEYSFAKDAHAIIEQFMYANMPLHLKRNQ